MKIDKKSAEYLSNLRHSCSHLMAKTVLELWPKAKRTLGPSIENGFYYDIDFGEVTVNGSSVAVKISEDDFPKIEKKMNELVKEWKGFAKEIVTAEKAKKFTRIMNIK